MRAQDCQPSGYLVNDEVFAFKVLIGCNGVLKVARVRKAVRANRTKIRQNEMAVKDFANVATRWPIDRHREADAALRNQTHENDYYKLR